VEKIEKKWKKKIISFMKKKYTQCISFNNVIKKYTFLIYFKFIYICIINFFLKKNIKKEYFNL